MSDFLLWVLAIVAATLLVLAIAAALAWWRIRRSPQVTTVRRIGKLAFMDKIRLLGALFRDPRVPLWPRVVAVALVLYLAMPIDIIPDFIPVLGYADDVLVAIVAAGLLAMSVPREVIEEHLSALESRPG